MSVSTNREPWSSVNKVAEGITLRIIQHVYGERLKTVEIAYPADWWQAVKERWAPAWFIRRWPVLLKQHKIEAVAFYPMISLPNEKHVVTLMHRDVGVL